MQISDCIDSVKGIGDKTRALFEKLNVNTVGQLLTYYPRDYETFPDRLRLLLSGREMSALWKLRFPAFPKQG